MRQGLRAVILRMAGRHEQAGRQAEVRKTHCGEEGLRHLVAPDERLVLPPQGLDPLVQLGILLLLGFQIQRGCLGPGGNEKGTETWPPSPRQLQPTSESAPHPTPPQPPPRKAHTPHAPPSGSPSCKRRLDSHQCSPTRLEAAGGVPGVRETEGLRPRPIRRLAPSPPMGVPGTHTGQPPAPGNSSLSHAPAHQHPCNILALTTASGTLGAPKDLP